MQERIYSSGDVNALIDWNLGIMRMLMKMNEQWEHQDSESI